MGMLCSNIMSGCRAVSEVGVGKAGLGVCTAQSRKSLWGPSVSPLRGERPKDYQRLSRLSIEQLRKYILEVWDSLIYFLSCSMHFFSLPTSILIDTEVLT